MSLNTHHPVPLPLASYKAQHVKLVVEGKLATLTLNRPDRKNPLTFQSYAEITGIFRAAAHDDQVKAFVIAGEGGALLTYRELADKLVATASGSHAVFAPRHEAIQE